jgi:hypothetical protein
MHPSPRRSFPLRIYVNRSGGVIATVPKAKSIQSPRVTQGGYQHLGMYFAASLAVWC